MPALACQVIEPAGNVVRLGQEAVSQIQRKATATVLFMNPSGVSNTIDPNVPAIPWTSSTGFGNGVTPPTTPGTVDVTTFAGRWVTFILAGANLSTQPMYVCQVTDFAQLACPGGGRTVVPLDVWELHGWRYAGAELAGPNVLAASGIKLVTVPANTDVEPQAIVWATDSIEATSYPAGVVPVVIPGAYDPGWIASVDAASIDHTGCTLKVARRIPLTNPQTGTVSLTFPSGASSYVYPSNPVAFPTAYDGSITPTPVIVPQTNHPDFIAQASSITTTGFDLTIYYRPNLSSGSVGTPSPNQSDDNTTDTTGMWGVGTGAPVSPIETHLAYSKVAGANGSGGDGATGNNSDGTDTGDSSASVTGGRNQTHVHPETTLPGNTGTDTPTHDHAMTHTHPHNSTGGDHTHPVPDAQHKHGNDDHVHNMNNHHHGLALHTHPFTGATTLTGGSQALTVTWESFGSRAAPSVSVTVSFLARG